jgi:hypothetical protein
MNDAELRFKHRARVYERALEIALLHYEPYRGEGDAYEDERLYWSRMKHQFVGQALLELEAENEFSPWERRKEEGS